MITRDDIAGIVENYDRMKLRVGMTASHSALDICDGAIEEGFPTVAYCKEGREKTYAKYFRSERKTKRMPGLRLRLPHQNKMARLWCKRSVLV